MPDPANQCAVREARYNRRVRGVRNEAVGRGGRAANVLDAVVGCAAAAAARARVGADAVFAAVDAGLRGCGAGLRGGEDRAALGDADGVADGMLLEARAVLAQDVEVAAFARGWVRGHYLGDGLGGVGEEGEGS